MARQAPKLAKAKATARAAERAARAVAREYEQAIRRGATRAELAKIERRGLAKERGVAKAGKAVRGEQFVERTVRTWKEKLLGETGERLTLDQARKDARYRKLVETVYRYKASNPKGKKARALVELGVRNPSASYPVGQSPRPFRRYDPDTRFRKRRGK